jgi:hypothetical protein
MTPARNARKRSLLTSATRGTFRELTGVTRTYCAHELAAVEPPATAEPLRRPHTRVTPDPPASTAEVDTAIRRPPAARAVAAPSGLSGGVAPLTLASRSGGRTRAEPRSLPRDTSAGDRATRGRPAAFAEPPRRYRLEQHSPVPSRTVPFANAPSGGHGALGFGLDFPATAVAFRQ